MKALLKKIPPGIFALVMASGMLSFAAHIHHLQKISAALFCVTVIFFVILVILFLLRCLLLFSTVAEELSTIKNAAGFLTVVAGCAVLGNGFAAMHGIYTVAEGLCLAALFTWVFFVYSILIRISVTVPKQSEDVMDGSWLLFTVATQSIVILLTTLLPHLDMDANTILLFLLAAFLAGAFLYVVFTTLILHRLFFARLPGAEISPAFWILMGAAAITVLAGTGIADALQPKPEYADLYPTIRLLVLLFWSVASVWIPFILLLDLWKYLVNKGRLKYEANLWSLVFPLAMYSVCSAKMTSLFPFLFLNTLSAVFLYVALVAWIVTFVGMCVSLVKRLLPRREGGL